MLVYSNTSIKILTLVVLASVSISANAKGALAQDGVADIMSTVESVLSAPEPVSDKEKTQDKKEGDKALDLRPPVPMLESGDYEFEDGSAAVDPMKEGEGQPAPANEYNIGEDAFYDTEAILPKGKVGRAGPAPVDPKKNPASKLVVVEAVSPKDNLAAQLVSAQRAMSLGRYDSALQLYDDLYAKNKKDSAVLMGRAVCLQKLGRFDEAMETYEDLSDLEPKNIEVKINMLGLLATRYPSVALRRLMDLHDANQQNVGLVAQIAVTAANLGDFDTAMRYLGIAMGMQPDNAGHIFNAAVILDRAGKTKDAVSYYEKALEVDAIYGGNRSVPREAIYERLAKLR